MTSTTTDRRFGVNAGKAVKVPCKAATTTNITLEGEQTIDGVACVTDDRVLVRSQTDAKENGIYIVDTGSWVRSSDFDDIFDVTQGTLINVNQGSSFGGSILQVDTTGTITPGTTEISFSFAFKPATGDISLFNNITAMKVSSPDAGERLKTQGYSIAGDGGGAEYLVVAPQAADGVRDHVLANGNVAVLQTFNESSFPDVATMKLAAIKSGVTVSTQGYSSAGDGGGATYLVVAPQAFDGYGDHELANGNIAVLQISGYVKASTFGNTQASIEAAIAVHDNIIVDYDVPIIATATWANGKNFTFVNAGRLSVATGVTLTIRGIITAEFRKLFYETGTGSVIGIKNVYPEWWGAVGDGVTNDQPALQKCVTSIQGSFSSDGGKNLINLSGANYLVSSTWVIYQTANFSISVEGAGTLIGGTRIITPVNFGSTAVAIEGSSDAIQRIVDFTFRGVAIIQTTVGFAGGVGLALNAVDGNFISGLQESLIEDVHITGFIYGILAQRTRLVAFNRVSVWNDGITVAANWCVQIRDSIGGAASFSGDSTFTQCQFVGLSTNANSIGVSIDATQSGSSVAGLRFDKCIFYKAATQLKITAVNDASMGDIWVTKCQFDGNQTIGVHATQVGAASTGYIVNLQIKDCYFTAASINFVRLIAAKQGGINGTNISNNYGAGVTQAAVEADYCNGITVSNNIWSGCGYAAGAAINFYSCYQVVANLNNFGQAGAALSGGFSYAVAFQAAGNYLVCQGTNSAGLFSVAVVQNTTGAANTSIANNI